MTPLCAEPASQGTSWQCLLAFGSCQKVCGFVRAWYRLAGWRKDGTTLDACCGKVLLRADDLSGGLT
jgi:hypothetical protein